MSFSTRVSYAKRNLFIVLQFVADYELKQIYIGGVPIETRSLPLVSLHCVRLEHVNYTQQLQQLLNKV